MKNTICSAVAFALALTTWTLSPAGAAPRCVANKRFVVLSGGLVSDTLTNLVWQQQASSTGMTWAEAKSYCVSPFRLPTVKELTSIVDLTVAPPNAAIDQTAFPGTQYAGFWTSSPYVGASGSAWFVAFFQGGVAHVGDGFLVRCVR